MPLGDVRGERTLPGALQDVASGLGPFVMSPDASNERRVRGKPVALKSGAQGRTSWQF
jgi:hypothetical protein